MGPPSSNEADNYRLYQSCATHEIANIVQVIQEALLGPLIEKVEGFSILDIGAGNGQLLHALAASCNVSRYLAFEQDISLCSELKHMASQCLSCPGTIQSTPFTPSTSFNERFDLVLLSHCLYGTESKLGMVEAAREHVAPGGLVVIVHRWIDGGTVDQLSQHLTLQSILHNVKIWDTQLDLTRTDCQEKQRLSRYTQGDTGTDEDGFSTLAIRTMGCITIEPDSCTVSSASALESIRKAHNRVGFSARKKHPALVVTPSTATGIQACLRAAALGNIGNGSVTVIGGGHSQNCFGDDAIVIGMQMWNYAIVDTDSTTVRVGGGATIGTVTTECEKHGLVVPLGDRPGVGVGLIIQGGLNHFMRRYGLATDQIMEVKYINPTGEIKVARSKEELFPFRGAGSNFGVVLEVTLQAHKLTRIVAQDVEYVLGTAEAGTELVSGYSDTASSLDNRECLDGFLYWSSHRQLSLTTSHFNTADDNSKSSAVLIPNATNEKVNISAPTICKPSDLFDRELYMTKDFAIESTLPDGVEQELRPKKLRSAKRCLLLPTLDHELGAKLVLAVQNAPTKWCYIHFLHGGGAVSRVPAEETAFGCRDWTFAAVVTARWPDGDPELRDSVIQWLERTTLELVQYSKGVYGSDLGPEDSKLARYAFGPNNQRLVELKQESDPLYLFRCGCPLVDSLPSSTQQAIGAPILLFCGRRFSGKDWLADIVLQTLQELLGISGKLMVSKVRISDETKRAYAQASSSRQRQRIGTDSQSSIQGATPSKVNCVLQ